MWEGLWATLMTTTDAETLSATSTKALLSCRARASGDELSSAKAGRGTASAREAASREMRVFAGLGAITRFIVWNRSLPDCSEFSNPHFRFRWIDLRRSGR